MNHLVIGLTIFILTYIAIVSEKINKTIAALFGACAMLFFHIIPQHEAFLEIDLNVIFLLMGMMVIVHITSQTGVFQWLAIKLAHFSKGQPLKIILYLTLITAVLSAFLDNVTTVILIAPVALLITHQLRINPVPFLILLTLSSNIGGTATSIGDPPNILIASATGLSFNDFLLNLGPVVFLIMLSFFLSIKLIFKNKLKVSRELSARIMALDPSRVIKNKKLLTQCLIVLSIVLILFFLHETFHLEPATIALGGAVILILITKISPEEVFKQVEWETIFFFIGLFIMVAAVVKIGIIAMIAHQINIFFGGQFLSLTMFTLWFSAFASSIIDNVPYVTTMIPMIKELSVTGVVLWWALALGSCLGGNFTLVGASANVIVAGIAEKNQHKISFWEFLKYGSFFTLQSLVISSIYIYFVYF